LVTPSVAMLPCPTEIVPTSGAVALTSIQRMSRRRKSRSALLSTWLTKAVE
jgi:hypothetical protein